MKLSATTVMMGDLDLKGICDLASRTGLAGVDLRVRRLPPQHARPLNLSPENLTERAPEIRSTVADHGLILTGLASNANVADLEQVRLLAEGAQAVGAPLMRLDSKRYDGSVPYHELFDQAILHYGKAVEIVRPYGVRIIVEMHGGTIHTSASLAWRLVSHFDPASIGVIYDPNNAVSDGFETVSIALDLLGKYLAHVHVGGHRPVEGTANDVGQVTWGWEWCELSEGLYDYRELFSCLRSRNYQGYVSIEDLRPDTDPEILLNKAMRYLESI